MTWILPRNHNISGTGSTATATVTNQLRLLFNLEKSSPNCTGHALAWLKRVQSDAIIVVLRHQPGRNGFKSVCPWRVPMIYAANSVWETLSQQSAWLGSSLDAINNPESVANVSRTLQLFAQFNRSEVHGQHSGSNSIGNSNISLPFLYSDLLVMGDLFMDRFYDDFRELFHFDPACCLHRPEPDESVFVSLLRQATSSIPWYFAH
jgi:hypothetical protein